MILVIGSGVAGLSCALAAAREGAEVELVTPGNLAAGDALAGGNTALAQGGIAAAIGEGDSWEAHLADTLAAGAGLVDREAAAALVRGGVDQLRTLLADGLPVDRGPDGLPLAGLEGAHGAPRILHSGGDRSGAALHAHLASRALAAGERVAVSESLTAVSLLMDAGAVVGAVLRDADGTLSVRRADAVVLATGGYAALFPRTSNQLGATGSGIALAARAGALVADLEFIQFHPTVLAEDTVLTGRGSLVSEAVRGAGAVLRDGSGRRFMVDRHPAAELAPRDVVSREIHRVLRERGDTQVWLDATDIERQGGRGSLAAAFPGITRATGSLGLDWGREPVPVTPAAHYTMGGVLSDLDGRSSVPGLFVAGEIASTGVHGANRLASNSLLEGLVFGVRAGGAAAAYVARPDWLPRGERFRALAAQAREERLIQPGSTADAADNTAAVARAVDAGLGIERDADGIREADRALRSLAGPRAEVAAMIASAAASRTESRGAHQRLDHPGTDPAQQRSMATRFVRDPATPVATPLSVPDARSLTVC